MIINELAPIINNLTKNIFFVNNLYFHLPQILKQFKTKHKMTKAIYCLFDGRHELPENSGAIFTGFDFINFVPTPNASLYTEFQQQIKAGEVVRLIVTGLTPALTYLLARVPKDSKLILLHYDSARECYQSQYFGNDGEAWTENRKYTMYRMKVEDAYMDYKYALCKDVADILKSADYSTGELQPGYTCVEFELVDVADLPDGGYAISNSAWMPMNYKYLGMPHGGV